MPLVTVGVPFYNDAKTLGLAIQSVFAQSIEDWELILVDDGSTDGSTKVASAVTDRRVRVLNHAENRGLASCLNTIAANASGKFIARMDADDVMHPERLQLQSEFLLANDHIDVLGTSMYSISSNTVPTGTRAPKFPEPSIIETLIGDTLIHPSVLARSDWFLANPYDESFRRVQDHELWVRAASNTKFANIDVPLIFVRESGTVTSAKYAASSQAERRLFLRYGRSIVGTRKTLALLLDSYLKESVFRAFALFGAQDLIVRRRNSPLSEHEKMQAMEVLEGIQRIDVSNAPTVAELARD